MWTLTSLFIFLLTIGQTILMKPDVIASCQYLVLVLLYDAADSLWWYARTVRPGGSSARTEGSMRPPLHRQGTRRARYEREDRGALPEDGVSVVDRYCNASKYVVGAITDSLRDEVAPFGIRVHSVRRVC